MFLFSVSSVVCLYVCHSSNVLVLCRHKNDSVNGRMSFYLSVCLYVCHSRNVLVSYRYEKDSVNGRTSYAIVGYTSVYSFYAYPDKIRPRIR